MKKVILVSLSVFAILFLSIHFLKKQPDQVDENKEISAEIASKRAKVLKFWEHMRQATNFRVAGDWEQALKSYEEALKYDERHEDALYYLGNMNLVLSRHKQAENAWLRLLEVYPKSSRAHQQLGNLYMNSDEMFDIKKAEQQFLYAHENNKEESGPVLLLGQANLIKGDLNKAASYFHTVTAMNFKSIDAYFLGAYIEWKRNNLASAKKLFGSAVAYSKPEEAPVKAVEKMEDKVFSEGDTKSGRTFEIALSLSRFSELLEGLSDIKEEDYPDELNRRYKKLDNLVTQLRRKIS